MPPLSDTRLRPLILGLVVLLLLLSSFATGVSTNRFATATDVFVSDDPDPNIGALPPFIQPDLRTILHSPNISAANASRARDFTYSTSQPSHEVGPHNQTLAEYRGTNLQNLPHNRSTSAWFPDSNRSNGTVVKNTHVTILGTQNGTQTRLRRANTSSQNLFLLPRNGTVLASLDYSTAIPNQTCTVTNGTKTCINYSITNQSINRSLKIGSQTWTTGETSQEARASRPLTYTDAQATERTTMVVEGTITTQLAIHKTVSIRTNSGWQQTNVTSNTTLLSHTVRDAAPVVITPNQQLNATQTLVTDNGDLKRIILRLDGPTTFTNRRHWSYASFKSGQMRLQNVWGVYSQHRYRNATIGTQHPNMTLSFNASQPLVPLNRSVNHSSPLSTTSQRTVPPPDVLEKQLIAIRSKPAIARTASQTASTATVSRVRTVPLAPKAAPLSPTVNLSSVPPRASTRVVITNVDQPLTTLYDIHGDEISLKTRTVSEHPVSLTLTKQDKRHVRIELTDAQTGSPIANQSVYLHGAVQGRVTTNSDGIAVVTRDESAVEATFRGVANDSQGIYYAPSHNQVRFAPTPFNIYSALVALSKGFVAVIAFVLFYLPFHYLRRR
ncbi:hypothetical protein ACFFQF_27460 [Haladaptatus pallidirubidus]|nr:hypothetical protein [Haladaptatus pallidirubidus]